MLLLFTSCIQEISVKEHYLFNIRAGEHYSYQSIDAFNDNILSFAFRFDESAIYDHQDSDQYDYNKLLGFTLGFDPHTNSARFAWRWNLEYEYIELAAYSYVDGNRDMYLIGYCTLDEIYSGYIEDTDSSFIFKYQGTIYERLKTEKDKQKYYSYPYFGGQKTAPNDINIEIWY